MKLKLWGTRGSIPAPGPDTVRYGGNTTSFSVDTVDDQLLIFDAGSGIRPLGLELLHNPPVNCHIFISHTHWDHIQGLPFFAPLFFPGSSIHIYGTFDPVYQKDLKTILTAQMEYCYFPVRASELRADITYTNLGEGETVRIGYTLITPFVMNHPVLTYGYRIDAEDVRIFYSGDHERLYNIYEPYDPEYDEYQGLVDAKEEGLIEFMHGSDLLIADCMYTSEEYATRVGWGHSTYDHWIDLATRAEVKHLLCSHHDPTRTDRNLDTIYQELQESRSWPGSMKVEIAREGAEFAFQG